VYVVNLDRKMQFEALAKEGALMATGVDPLSPDHHQNLSEEFLHWPVLQSFKPLWPVAVVVQCDCPLCVSHARG